MIKELSKKQKATMEKHSVHHTKKHMATMTKKMMNGSTFSESHKFAMKKDGK
tara:strand:+ start:8212 stop:8367 length:156 start_codon:yes stop_codon:yes gene_type:complete